MGKLEQWVNLKKKSAYAEGDSLSRIGTLRLRAKFKNDKLCTYKWKIQRTDGVKYSKAERKRNRRFRLFKGGVRTNENKKEIKSTQNFHLPAAGGNRYKAVAIQNRKEVKSAEVEVRRRLWYQVMHMKSVKPLNIAPKLKDAFWNPGKKLYIESKEAGKKAGIKYLKTIWDVEVKTPDPEFTSTTHAHGMGNGGDFIKATKKAWKGADKAPYAYAVAFVNYITTSTEKTLIEEVNFSVPSKLTKWSWGGDQIELELGTILWWDLVPKDDKAQSWFIGGWIVFADKDGTSNFSITLDSKDVRPSGPDYGAHGGKTRVKIRITEEDVKRHFFSKREGRWFVKLAVRTAGGWSGGFAYTYIPLIAIATKSFFNDEADDEQLATVMHEVGHKVGLAATGQGFVPDKTGDLYGFPKGAGDDRGHWGPHCAYGAAWDGSKWSGTPKCVMFGANGYYDAGAKTFVNRKPEFCPKCEKIIRKLDLASPTLTVTGFKESL